ncbi:protein LDOC1-like [Ambystoma mexicanum]|uniref:protein LDOC1-like n=1 Tax=Ambystoma mexicanum TaxID=8296 RepID=UPI0037E7149C
MEEIAKALQDLQGELAVSRQDYATVSAQVRSLAAQTSPLPGQAPVQVQVTPDPVVPLAPPERYSGDSQKFSTFITQCHLHFLTKPAAFRSHQSRTAFVISYLTGDAAAWANPLVQKDNMVLYDWDDFLSEFEKIFNQKAATLCKDRELLALRQGNKELVTYVTQLNRLVATRQKYVLVLSGAKGLH